MRALICDVDASTKMTSYTLFYYFPPAPPFLHPVPHHASVSVLQLAAADVDGQHVNFPSDINGHFASNSHKHTRTHTQSHLHTSASVVRVEIYMLKYIYIHTSICFIYSFLRYLLHMRMTLNNFNNNFERWSFPIPHTHTVLRPLRKIGSKNLREMASRKCNAAALKKGHGLTQCLQIDLAPPAAP